MYVYTVSLYVIDVDITICTLPTLTTTMCTADSMCTVAVDDYK